MKGKKSATSTPTSESLPKSEKPEQQNSNLMAGLGAYKGKIISKKSAWADDLRRTIKRQ